ncbi:Amidase domain-containing protein [Sergentomyia squamirostris]
MDIILRFFILLTKIFDLLIYPLLIIHGAIFTPKKTLPPFDNCENCDLLTIPAVDLAQKIRIGEVKSVDVVKAYINRIEAVNPLINAIVEKNFNQALEMAKEADLKCKEMDPIYLEEKFPLLGVPVTIKECLSVAGLPLTMGNYWRRNIRATENSDVVGLVLKAGAIPLLVSNTPEYCYSWETNNFMTGRTLNPYDQRRIPGGSSGGEGVLLGSGASLIGIGSDSAGSIRIPASYNGVFGHKPTSEAVSPEGILPDLSNIPKAVEYTQPGPMCRYAKDLPLLLKIMSENNSDLKLDEFVPIEKIRIFYKKGTGGSQLFLPYMSSDVSEMFDLVVEYFRNPGVKPMPFDVDLSDLPEYFISGCSLFKGLPSIFVDPSGQHKTPNMLLELLKCPFGCSKFTFAGMYLMMLTQVSSFMFSRIIPKYMKKLEILKNEMVTKLGSNGVLLFIIAPKPALRHHEYYNLWYGNGYAFLFNMLGFPATSVPISSSPEGLPIGIQVVAAPHQDRLCFSVAQNLEKAFGGWKPPK